MDEKTRLFYRAELPKPNEFGDIWLDEGPMGPAIFASNKVRPGKFFASKGPHGGVLFDGPRIRYFDSAQEAWLFLRAQFCTR
jgi:hypothetical protein